VLREGGEEEGEAAERRRGRRSGGWGHGDGESMISVFNALHSQLFVELLDYQLG
jgi:hypothetical protein